MIGQPYDLRATLILCGLRSLFDMTSYTFHSTLGGTTVAVNKISIVACAKTLSKAYGGQNRRSNVITFGQPFRSCSHSYGFPLLPAGLPLPERRLRVLLNVAVGSR